MNSKVKMFLMFVTALFFTAVFLSPLIVGVSCTMDHTRPNPQEDVNEMQWLLNCNKTKNYQELSSFTFKPRFINKEDSVCLSLRMFKEMDFVHMFNISENTLFRFIVHAQKGYRELPYHNWSHAFAVLQFSFAVLKNCKLIEKRHFTPLEGLALLTAAICHDIDHSGTNNQFQLNVNSSLAQKYGEMGSIMERHHIAVTFGLFENSDINFLVHLDKNKQNNFKNLIREIIIATDLSVHLKLMPEEKQMAAVGFDSLSSRHRELLRSVIISCADLSDHSEDWATVREVAKLVYTEFYTQGDLEKQLSLTPITMMDRSQSKLPQLQVDFLLHVVIPDFQMLLALYPETQICVDKVQQNFVYWKKAIPYFESQSQLGRDQLAVLSDKKLDNISLVQ